jgi:hypothetical protein
MKTNFIPYTNVSTARLQEIAVHINQISETDFREAVVNQLRTHFGDVILEECIYDFDTEKTSINGIENAAIIVKYSKYPLTYSDGMFLSGQAQQVKLDKGKSESNVIPVVFLFLGDKSLGDLKHEKIHVCQGLLDSYYPLSKEEFDLISSQELFDVVSRIRESTRAEEVMRLIINTFCNRLWVEGEAAFHSGETDLNSWLFEVCSNVRPIYFLEEFRDRLGWENNTWNTVLKRLSNFCLEMQTEVDWLREMLGGQSLFSKIRCFSNKVRLQLEREDAREKNDILEYIYKVHEKNVIITDSKKTGRNEPCPCGSGKKYKKCCLNNHEAA